MQKIYKNWNVDVDNIVIPKLFETKSNSKYFIGYLDKVIKPLVLILPKISRYVKTITFKDKDKNDKFTSFRRDDEKLLENYKTIWIKDFKYLKTEKYRIECFVSL